MVVTVSPAARTIDVARVVALLLVLVPAAQPVALPAPPLAIVGGVLRVSHVSASAKPLPFGRSRRASLVPLSRIHTSRRDAPRRRGRHRRSRATRARERRYARGGRVALSARGAISQGRVGRSARGPWSESHRHGRRWAGRRAQPEPRRRPIAVGVCRVDGDQPPAPLHVGAIGARAAGREVHVGLVLAHVNDSQRDSAHPASLWPRPRARGCVGGRMGWCWA